MYERDELTVCGTNAARDCDVNPAADVVLRCRKPSPLGLVSVGFA